MNDKNKIRNQHLDYIMDDRFKRYTKSIIQERAIPSALDGLKPVQRRVLYTMLIDHNVYNKAFKKSARAVGNTMGAFHPHGDSSIYGALIDMSQPWKMRLPLIDLHGNNGSMDGDPAAAMRYTEARLSKASNAMMLDLKRGTVPWVLNYDDTQKEPTVLPSRFPNLIVNGANGISSGYATKIPPHNLGETIDAVIYLQSHPDASLTQIMHFIKGPDFPTGGILQGEKGLRKAYETGRGKVLLRARCHITKIKGGKQQIRITEIPYGVNKRKLVHHMDVIRIEHKINGIDMVEDDSDRHGLLITITLKRGADAHSILGYLYKHTKLSIFYHFNVVAIDQMQPKLMPLKTALTSYLQYQRRLVYRRTKYDLRQIYDKQELVRGYMKALDNLDTVIKIIRSSYGRDNSAKQLENKLGFSEKQAKFIVDLRLYRLNNASYSALQAHDQLLDAKADYCKSILSNPVQLDLVLRKELLAIKREFNTPRRTTIKHHIQHVHISRTITIPNEKVVMLVSRDGYLKRSSERSFSSSQNVKGNKNGLKLGDYPLFIQHMNARNSLVLFTNLGRIIYRPINDIHEVPWKATGQNITQSIKMKPNEQIIKVFGMRNLKNNHEFLIETNDGYIKRTHLQDMLPGRTYRHHAPSYVNLKSKSSRVVNVMYLPGKLTDTAVLLMTKFGFGLRFNLSEVPVNGSNAAGVKAMNLNKHDTVIGMQLCTQNDVLGILSKQGLYSLLPVKYIPLMARNRKGRHVTYHTSLHWPEISNIIITDPYNKASKLSLYTKYRRHCTINSAKFSLSEPYRKGKRAFAIDKLGEPEFLTY